MRRFIDDAVDDHPSDEEKSAVTWSLALSDDCETCADLRVVLTLEELDRKGEGLVAHLAPAGARRLRAALAGGLKELGEDPGA